MFITPLYAAFFGILLVILSWRIQKLRLKTQPRMNEETHSEMTAATRAQSHLIEYTPMALLLMLMAEFQETSPFLLHALGLTLVAARLLHLKGLKDPSGKSPLRKTGTRLTWLVLVIGSITVAVGSLRFTF